MSSCDPRRTLEAECCSGKNERRSLGGGTSRGAILAYEIIELVGSRVKRGCGDTDKKIPANPSP
jgi:hypothetical protein